MERHLSTGVATIVALMAAHRMAAEDHAVSLTETIAGIEACLTPKRYGGGRQAPVRPLREADERPSLAARV